MRMDKNKKAILAQRVKERMRMLGMNALQLSEKSGVSQSIISRLTNEKAFPSAGSKTTTWRFTPSSSPPSGKAPAL